MEHTMESFYTTLFSEQKSPYYKSLHNLIKMSASQIQEQSRKKPQPTRGWVMWVQSFDDQNE